MSRSESAEISPDKKAAILDLFTCQKSGNCCRCPGVVKVSESDCIKMAQRLGVTRYSFGHSYVLKRDGYQYVSTRTHRPNCFLDSHGTCQVYEQRPKMCRTYPDWPSVWESEAALLAEAEQCPGLKKAIKDHHR